MDPLLIYIATALCAVVLLIGGLDKVRNFDLFEGSVLAYRLVPVTLSKPFSVLFVAAELGAVALLLVPQTRHYGALLALLTIAVATAGVVVNLLRGHTNVSCGCGNLKQQSAGLSWWLVVRNTLLLAIAAMLLLPSNIVLSRQLDWFDGFTFFGATLAMLGLYFIGNQLIESHVKLQKLKEI